MKTIFTASGIMTLNYTLHLPHVPDIENRIFLLHRHIFRPNSPIKVSSLS